MFTKLKYFTLGIIMATLINIGITFAEDEYFQLKRVEYPIFINGVETNLESLIFNYEGSTYIPLRKIAEVTGSKVIWNNNLKSVIITNTTAETIKEVIKEVPVEKIVYVTPAPSPTYLKFENGTYEGISNLGIMDKVGKFKWDAGDLYIGDWNNGFRSGKGAYFFQSGNVYVGDFKENKRNGNGSMIYANGDCQTGIWENDTIKTITKDARIGTPISIPTPTPIPMPYISSIISQNNETTTVKTDFLDFLVDKSTALINSDLDAIEVQKNIKDKNLVVKDKYGSIKLLEHKGFSFLHFNEGSYYCGKINSYDAILIDKFGEVKEFYTK